MRKRRTFIDSGVLITAARGTPELAERALAVLDDPSRSFVTSDLVRLEVLPKAVYHAQNLQAQFYETFFGHARRMVKSSARLVSDAESEAERSGLSAMDAPHVVAAKRGRCDELITTEKPTKPLFRVDGLPVTSIRT